MNILVYSLIWSTLLCSLKCNENIQELQVKVTKYAEKCLMRSRNGDTLHM